MYSTPDGVRILRGDEARLFESAAAMMVDVLADGDTDFGIDRLAEVPYGQKLVLFQKLILGLLHTEVTPPEVTPVMDALAWSVYGWIDLMVLAEIHRDCRLPRDGSLSTWRELLLAAARDCQLDEVEFQENESLQEGWSRLVWQLSRRVVWSPLGKQSSAILSTAVRPPVLPLQGKMPLPESERQEWRSLIVELKQLTSIDR